MNIKKVPFFSVYVIFAVALILHSSATQAQTYTIKPIVSSRGELFPDSDLIIQSFYVRDLAINNNGDFVFQASFFKTPANSDSFGIFLFSNDELKLLISSPSSLFADDTESIQVSSPDINDNGTVVFFGLSFTDNSKNFKQEIFKFENNEIVPIVSPGDLVNGIDETIANVESAFGLSLNNNEEIAFDARLSNGRVGIFVLTEEGINPILIAGDGATVSGGSNILRPIGNPVVNDKGEVAFIAEFLNGIGVVLFSDGEFFPINIPGAEAPGTNGKIFAEDRGVGFYSLGNNSTVVYSEGFIKQGSDSNKRSDRRGSGVFLWSKEKTIPLILTGDRLPETRGFALGHTTGNFGNGSINDSGEIAASLVTTGLGGLFVLSDNEVIPVLLSKDTRNELESLILPGTAAINNRGDIIFLGTDILGRQSIFLATKDE